jgi:hypothetical protein
MSWPEAIVWTVVLLVALGSLWALVRLVHLYGLGS